MEELRDVYQHFLLYYGQDLPKMKTAMQAKARAQRAEKRELQRQRREAGLEEAGEEETADAEEEQHESLKQASRKSGYNICQQAGLGRCSCFSPLFINLAKVTIEYVISVYAMNN